MIETSGTPVLACHRPLGMADESRDSGHDVLEDLVGGDGGDPNLFARLILASLIGIDHSRKTGPSWADRIPLASGTTKIAGCRFIG